MLVARTEDLTIEYSQDSNLADSKYAGKSMQITGKIFYIGESQAGEAMVLFEDPNNVFLNVAVYFKGIENNQISNIVDGIEITVEGVMQEKPFGSLVEFHGEKIININL